VTWDIFQPTHNHYNDVEPSPTLSEDKTLTVEKDENHFDLPPCETVNSNNTNTMPTKTTASTIMEMDDKVQDILHALHDGLRRLQNSNCCCNGSSNSSSSARSGHPNDHTQDTTSTKMNNPTTMLPNTNDSKEVVTNTIDKSFMSVINGIPTATNQNFSSNLVVAMDINGNRHIGPVLDGLQVIMHTVFPWDRSRQPRLILVKSRSLYQYLQQQQQQEEETTNQSEVEIDPK
jgi:uncharacterized membrane protein